MTRLDATDDATETSLPGGAVEGASPSEVQVLAAREVPLGGLRAMTVMRTLPHRELPTIGAWCFADHFASETTAMSVDPHPHMGLQTVTWPLRGEVRHRDSVGSDVVLRPGELNLMTSGHGIAHSEVSLAGEGGLDAVQLWVALPSDARSGKAGFEHHSDLPTVDVPAVAGAPARAVVFMGTFAGVASAATTYTSLVGVQVNVAPGSTVDLPLNPAWEYGVLLVHGDVTIVPGEVPSSSGVSVAPDDLAYMGRGRASVRIASGAGATLLLLGGEPLGEDLVMWWNFVGRTHEEIEQAWHDWQARTGRFGEVDGHGDIRIPAPPLPTVRLLPRRRVH